MGGRALNLRGEFPTGIRSVTVRDSAEAAQLRAMARQWLRPGCRLALLSPPAAAHYLSPGLFLAITGPEDPDCLPVLDCGAAPGHALAALRAGCPALVLRPGPAFPAVAGAARDSAALLLPERPPSLEMATLRPDTPRGVALLRSWLIGEAEPCAR